MLNRLFDKPKERRRQFLFRGHADASWGLQSTLVRKSKFANDEDRDAVIRDLVIEFKRECLGIEGAPQGETDERAWELLGRHHGRLTPLIDWTVSPFVAAYFAFGASQKESTDRAAIWGLDLELFNAPDTTGPTIIYEDDLIRANRRAIAQRGAFLRIDSIARPVEDLLGEYLFKLLLPLSERSRVLAELDAMLIILRTRGCSTRLNMPPRRLNGESCQPAIQRNSDHDRRHLQGCTAIASRGSEAGRGLS
ncbi:MAG: FRG domain-containing protein [Planctomycetota bacterium]